MKAKIWLCASLLSMCGVAMAQSSAVTQSTDPAKISEIEQHAQALASNQPTQADMGHMKKHKKMHKMHKKMKAMDKENMDKGNMDKGNMDKKPEGDTPMMEKKG